MADDLRDDLKNIELKPGGFWQFDFNAERNNKRRILPGLRLQQENRTLVQGKADGLKFTVCLMQGEYQRDFRAFVYDESGGVSTGVYLKAQHVYMRGKSFELTDEAKRFVVLFDGQQ